MLRLCAHRNLTGFICAQMLFVLCYCVWMVLWDELQLPNDFVNSRKRVTFFPRMGDAPALLSPEDEAHFLSMVWALCPFQCWDVCSSILSCPSTTARRGVSFVILFIYRCLLHVSSFCLNAACFVYVMRFPPRVSHRLCVVWLLDSRLRFCAMFWTFQQSAYVWFDCLIVDCVSVRCFEHFSNQLMCGLTAW